MKNLTWAVAAVAASAWATYAPPARADSISVSSATGVGNTIQANGKWAAPTILKIMMQVSTDNGKTWTEVGMATQGMLTWSGTTNPLPAGNYSFRVALYKDAQTITAYSTVTQVNVPGKGGCGPTGCNLVTDENDEQTKTPPDSER